MNEIKLKCAVGFLMIVGNFGIVLLVIALYFKGGFSVGEMTTTAGLIGPLFAGYTSVIFSFIIKNKNRVAAYDKIVNIPYVSASFFLPTCFILCLIGVILAKAFNFGFPDFESFKAMVVLLQSIFGIYVGQFIYSMFEAAKPKNRASHGR